MMYTLATLGTWDHDAGNYCGRTVGGAAFEMPSSYKVGGSGVQVGDLHVLNPPTTPDPQGEVHKSQERNRR